MTAAFRLSARSLCLTIALIGAPALASGYLSLPDQHERLSGFAACIARLEAAAQEDRGAAEPMTIDAEGITHSVEVESRTNGILREGRHRARYHGRVWTAHGRIAQHDPGQREVTHSWQERELRCDGRNLTISSASGFTLSTFEPVNAADAPPALPPPPQL